MTTEYLSSPEVKIENVESLVASTPEIAGLQVYEYFRNNATTQKAGFISGEVPSLHLFYPHLTEVNVQSLAVPALEALRRLMPTPINEKSEALYRTLEYRYAELSMMQLAVRLNDPALTGEERAQTLGLFRQTNEALYGAPDKAIFSSLLGRRMQSFEHTETVDKSFIEIRDDLNGLVGEYDEPTYDVYAADEAVVLRIGKIVTERLGFLVEHIEQDKTYDIQSLKEALLVSLDVMGATSLGWKVDIVEDSSSFATSAHRKIVEVGAKRPEVTGAELSPIILHELGIHVLRSVNAQKAGWVSAAYGQDGYLDFEESVATALEDAYNGKFDDHGQQYYLAAGLVYGLDNHELRDMRETYEVMWRIWALEGASEGVVNDNQLQRAKSAAFSQCVRLFRGTTSKDKGTIYLKDLAYFKGQEAAWSVLDDVYTQEDFDLILAGKLDLTREDHTGIAEKIVAYLRSNL